MKTRLGFVSNSSSASYTVNITGSFEEFANCVASELWQYVSSDVLEKDSKKRLEHFEKYNPDHMYDSRISNLKSLVEFVENNGDPSDRLKLALFLNHVDVKQHSNNFTLESFTSMHNDYVEGVPDILKELILLVNFEFKQFPIVCKVDHDN